MNILVVLLLLCVVAFFVGYPLIKPEYDSDEDNMARNQKLKSEKDAVMTTLNEIEFDYQMGKLSDDDYEIMKNKYKLSALEILKEEEDQKLKNIKSTDSKKEIARIDDEIERELKQMRAKKADKK